MNGYDDFTDEELLESLNELGGKLGVVSPKPVDPYISDFELSESIDKLVASFSLRKSLLNPVIEEFVEDRYVKSTPYARTETVTKSSVNGEFIDRLDSSELTLNGYLSARNAIKRIKDVYAFDNLTVDNVQLGGAAHALGLSKKAGLTSGIVQNYFLCNNITSEGFDFYNLSGVLAKSVDAVTRELTPYLGSELVIDNKLMQASVIESLKHIDEVSAYKPLSSMIVNSYINGCMSEVYERAKSEVGKAVNCSFNINDSFTDLVFDKNASFKNNLKWVLDDVLCVSKKFITECAGFYNNDISKFVNHEFLINGLLGVYGKPESLSDICSVMNHVKSVVSPFISESFDRNAFDTAMRDVLRDVKDEGLLDELMFYKSIVDGKFSSVLPGVTNFARNEGLSFIPRSVLLSVSNEFAGVSEGYGRTIEQLTHDSYWINDCGANDALTALQMAQLSDENRSAAFSDVTRLIKFKKFNDSLTESFRDFTPDVSLLNERDN